MHCADVIRYCFGENDHANATYTRLLNYCDDWYSLKPSAFAPLWTHDWNDKHVFPEIWILGNEVVTGLQYYHLTKILLTAHNPKIPRLGPGRAAALKAMDVSGVGLDFRFLLIKSVQDEIKQDVRIMCGMTLSNNVAPSFEYVFPTPPALKDAAASPTTLSFC